MESQNIKRFNGLDILKAICAFLVVFIHVPIQGFMKEYLVALCRIAVPIFFMITGYFWSNDLNKQKKQIVKIVKLIVFTILIYLVKEIIVNICQGTFISFINQWFDIKRYFNLIVFNRTYLAYHMWYLVALLYVLIILYFVTKKIKIERLFILIPILLSSYIVIQMIASVFNIDGWDYIYVRNFLFTGIPFVLLGKYLSLKKINLSNKKHLILIVVFVLLNIIEMIISNIINYKFIPELFLTGIFLAILVFTYFLNINAKNDNFLVVIGKKYSMYIYIFHVLIVFFVTKFIDIFNSQMIQNIGYNLLPFIVYFFSLIISILMSKIIKLRKQN